MDTVPLVLGFLSIAVFIYAYHETFLWLYERYNNPNSHYSHGFLIPLISGYLIWQKRNQLRELIRPGSRIGLFLMVIACLVHIGSVWTHIFFLSGFSILLLVIGLSLYLFGADVTRAIAFPLAFLVFMFPLPMRAVDAISFPLKLMVANISTGMIGYAGIPILREGSVIHLANTSMTIGDPCSGIRSLISLLALGALIAHLAGTGMIRKMVIFASSIPIAIVTNVLRVCLLILAANWLGGGWASPDHWFHTASGMGVFVISMVLLLLTARLLE
jgi:exosortase A